MGRAIRIEKHRCVAANLWETRGLAARHRAPLSHRLRQWHPKPFVLRRKYKQSGVTVSTSEILVAARTVIEAFTLHAVVITSLHFRSRKWAAAEADELEIITYMPTPAVST
jgi:hypothetical protein